MNGTGLGVFDNEIFTDQFILSGKNLLLLLFILSYEDQALDVVSRIIISWILLIEVFDL